ncbi:MAG TPA: hypothetical protein VLA16_16880 [Ideonella sp.]|nr:hypothetical protein [Ideonella sp.]
MPLGGQQAALDAPQLRLEAVAGGPAGASLGLRHLGGYFRQFGQQLVAPLPLGHGRAHQRGVLENAEHHHHGRDVRDMHAALLEAAPYHLIVGTVGLQRQARALVTARDGQRGVQGAQLLGLARPGVAPQMLDRQRARLGPMTLAAHVGTRGREHQAASDRESGEEQQAGDKGRDDARSRARGSATACWVVLLVSHEPLRRTEDEPSIGRPAAELRMAIEIFLYVRAGVTVQSSGGESRHLGHPPRIAAP